MRRAALLALLLALAAPAFAAKVTAIRVEGAQRVEDTTIASYSGLAVGQDAGPGDIAAAIEDVFASGLFEDVAITQSGGAVTIQVTENPVINQIAFEGNEKLKDEDLAAEIALAPRQVLSRSAVAADVERIAQIYRRSGRYAATITPEAIALDEGRVNLVFSITEGPRTTVARIAFVGNTSFSDADLRAAIATRQAAWWRFWSTADRYDPDKMRFDEQQLRAFYLARGYADAEVTGAVAELSADKRDFVLTYTVAEGPRYRVSDVRIDSAVEDLADTAPFMRALSVEKGQWYNAEKVSASADALTDALAERRLVFVRVDSGLVRDEDADPERPTGAVVFRVSPAPPAYVERIEITGNARTHDAVIRRRIPVVEGDPVNRQFLDRARQRIQDLGYFKSVDLDVQPGSGPGQKVVELRVEEQSTGSISVGAGFSTADGFLGDVRLRERNLLGRGYDTTLGASLAQKRTEFQLSLTDPYFLGKDLIAGFDVYHITRDLQDESSFDERRTGGALRLGYPLSAQWRQMLRYRLQDNEITNVQDNASRYVKDQEGQRLTSALAQTLTFDNRDSTLSPTEGWRSWIDIEVSGLGGDAQFVSARAGTTAYYSLRPQWILEVTGEGGAIEGYGGDTPTIAERFYLGGYNMRGFSKGGLGPRDLSTDDALGGKYFARGTVELSIPTPAPKEYAIKAHVFTDFGTLWGLDDGAGDPDIVDDKSLRASVGVGASWDSP
ncbi:MAG TPA: outer membrane protein assembly factor BamA, partial [Rhodospirillaceae bacterium]|nr:outer membrane protein assembly factor BamA [Rhodospirillaceae bacterium]